MLTDKRGIEITDEQNLGHSKLVDDNADILNSATHCNHLTLILIEKKMNLAQVDSNPTRTPRIIFKKLKSKPRNYQIESQSYLTLKRSHC